MCLVPFSGFGWIQKDWRECSNRFLRLELCFPQPTQSTQVQYSNPNPVQDRGVVWRPVHPNLLVVRDQYLVQVRGVVWRPVHTPRAPGGRRSISCTGPRCCLETCTPRAPGCRRSVSCTGPRFCLETCLFTTELLVVRDHYFVSPLIDTVLFLCVGDSLKKRACLLYCNYCIKKMIEIKSILYRSEVLTGDLFTPELMVVGDLNTQQIQLIYQKVCIA